jgi:predicted transposase YbfD/YdcC
MQCNAPAAGSASGKVDPVVFDVRTLWRRLAALGDRRQPRGKRYGLALVLLLVVLAKLSGEDRPSGIADWVRHRRELLAQALGLDLVRTPHHNTYRRILAGAVLPGDLDGEISAFFRDLPQVGRSVLISIDGKTVRGTIHTEDPRGTHLLAAYLPSEGIVLLQLRAGHKDNEIGVAPALLRGIDLRGKIVAADAMHTQREFSAEILAAGGEYLFLVKDNQPTLREEVELLFTADHRTVEGGEVVHDFKTARQVNKGHGRREVRQITVSAELKGYCDWPGLEQVFRLERQRIEIKTGEIEEEVVYGLTSLSSSEASPARLLELTRAYWGVENGLHYRRDVTFREDATRLTKGHAGHVMASLNNLVIGLLRLAGFTNLAAARRYCDADLSNALALLSSTTRQ